MTTATDYAADLAIFLVEKTGSCLGNWTGNLPAAQQRALFGRFLGKGKLIIDGSEERLAHVVKRCFGLDYEVTADLAWRNL
jgi:hypothetical protein